MQQEVVGKKSEKIDILEFLILSWFGDENYNY